MAMDLLSAEALNPMASNSFGSNVCPGILQDEEESRFRGDGDLNVIE
jgi:hypothetical protein